MSPELEKYLVLEEQLEAELSRLSLDLEKEEHKLQRALGSQDDKSTWGAFFVVLIIAALLLNSLAIHMGALLGWWDPNALVGIVDQHVSALKSYETDVEPLLFAVHALGWMGESAFTIFFALPYGVLEVFEELISMVLPVASPFLPYVEGVILGFFALKVLKMCPPVQGFRRGLANTGSEEAARSRKRISELKREIKAKEAELNRIPRNKLKAARKAKSEEQKQQLAEKRRLDEEAKRRQQEEAERQRQEEERLLQEAECQRQEEERQRQAEERPDSIGQGRHSKKQASPYRATRAYAVLDEGGTLTFCQLSCIFNSDTPFLGRHCLQPPNTLEESEHGKVHGRVQARGR